ncbi:GntR family transcriptional regulator [Enterovibrio calviensis]|uniref:GntR family transcriptional regulator n=1 Tax=Enterovibrio calviensis TaxID=91359 RepID=UPI0004831D4A|nr:GntR family transcriptional regulator [Enterovibrio calviensis]
MNTHDNERIERPKSLTEMVIERLQTAIMEGDLKLGQALSETMLATKFGVSKTPVREALFRLKQEGVVDIIPQKGSFVFLPDPHQVNDLCEFRAYIEPLGLAEAFQEGGLDFLDDLEVCVTKMRRLLQRDDLVGYLRMDTQFHQTFFDYCANPYLKASYALISTKAAALRSHMSMNKSKADMSNLQHIEILELLNDGKIEEAIALLKRHIVDIKKDFLVTVS